MNPSTSIVVSSEPIPSQICFFGWRDGYKTAKTWKYDFGRIIKRGEQPSYAHLDERATIPVYHRDQTSLPKKPLSDLDTGKIEFLRRFWLHSRQDRYLACDNDPKTIDCKLQADRGNTVGYLGEEALVDHLQGKQIYGIFPEQARRARPAQTYWVAVDLDLHLYAGGNLELFWRQVKAILPYLWGHKSCQVVVSRTKANGIHIYLYFARPLPLDEVRAKMRTILTNIHNDNSELAEEVAAWNARLKAVHSGKNWQVKQIKDLEIYPDPNHGFRCIGTRGKVVLADKEIGIGEWGRYKRGCRKGQLKYGFDVASWWQSLNTPERMPLQDVFDYIQARLPDKSEQQLLKQVETKAVAAEATPTAPESAPDSTRRPENVAPPAVEQRLSSPSPQPKIFGSLHRQTRRKITGYWLGEFNPPGCFERVAIITARLFSKEGLTLEDATARIQQFAREIPSHARECSKRLEEDNWHRIDQDIEKAVRNAFNDNGRQSDPRRSDNELSRTIQVWSRYGFQLSDKSTWGKSTSSHRFTAKVNWTEQDKRDFELWLMPALKIKDANLAVDVATSVVQLTLAKEAEESGWGYSFLKVWLPDKFGIRCSQKAKQGNIFKALQELGIIRKRVQHRRGWATCWTLGKRAEARLSGNQTEKWRDEGVKQEGKVEQVVDSSLEKEEEREVEGVYSYGSVY